MRRLRPGDVMIVKWLQLEGQPVSTYLIVAVTEDEDEVLYFHSGHMQVHQTANNIVSTMMESAAKKEVEFEVVHA